MNEAWTWDEASATWLYGMRGYGCGVFEEGGTWFANVVTLGVECVGPFGTKDEAMESAVRLFAERKAR